MFRKKERKMTREREEVVKCEETERGNQERK